MDKNIKILLGSKKNISSVNVDNYEKIELTRNVAELNEYDVNTAVNATEIFDKERQETEIYRIYGRVEFFSLLNGLKSGYDSLDDFFIPVNNPTSKNVVNSFDWYLIKPATGYTNINNSDYIRYFKVIATPADFDIYPVGFSNNVFGEQQYAFNLRKDYDISQLVDNFGFPITELYLYPQYIPAHSETMLYTKWENGSAVKSSFSPAPLNIGDYVTHSTTDKVGDKIIYDKKNFKQELSGNQIYYIKTPYSSTYLQWKYNPFIPLQLRYFSGFLDKANTGDTAYDRVNIIPPYATKIDNNGNFVWRNILPQGEFDPITGEGVNYPFVNKRRYLFSSTLLSVTPDLSDSVTSQTFSSLAFGLNPITINNSFDNELNNIGKPCQ